MLFKNPQIEFEELPQARAVEMMPLQNDYKKVMRFNVLLFFIPLFIFTACMAIFGPSEENVDVAGYIGLATTAVLFLLFWFLINPKFKVKSYAIREKDIMFRSGLIWRKTTTIPFNRIQHSEIKEGPISKRYGLCTLLVFTAGGAQSDVKIPGLQKDEGVRIKDFILGKTIAYDEEE